MYERYSRLRDQLGYRDADLARELSITSSTFSDWKNGKSNPNAEKLLRIARFLHTTMEYLMTGEEDDPTPKSTVYLLLQNTIYDMNDEDLSVLLFHARALKQRIPA